jgi:dTMP kinase
MRERGKFIVFEGIDGCGKSTQFEMLKEWLGERNVSFTSTKEHTTGPAGQLIEEVLTRKKKLPSLALQFLFVADRIDDTEKIIKPGLEAGKLVVADRYGASTTAYGGVNEGTRSRLWMVNNWIMEQPYLWIYVDLDPEKALERIGKGRNTTTIFEEKVEFLQLVRKNYEWISKQVPKGRWLTVIGDDTKENIFEKITKGLIERKIVCQK